MSLVSSYIKCNDGKWYQNLVYRDQNNEWFICFDDDDPVELVIREFRNDKRDARAILTDLGIPFNRFYKNRACGMRVFGSSNTTKFNAAESYFLDVKNVPFPAPTAMDTYDQRFDEMPKFEGVYYGWDGKSK